MSRSERNQKFRFREEPSYQSNTLREVLDEENSRRQEDEGAMLTPTGSNQLPATDRSHGEESQLISEDEKRTAYEQLERAFFDKLNHLEAGDLPNIDFSQEANLPEPLVTGHIYGRVLYPVYEQLRSQLGLPRLDPKIVMARQGQPAQYKATYVATTAVFTYLQDTGKLLYARDERLFLRQMRGIPSFLDLLQEGISAEFGLSYPPLHTPILGESGREH